MTRYVYRDGKFRHPSSGEPMEIPQRDGVCMPAVRGDITEYRSPVDGTLVTSRSARKYDLEKNDCVDIGPPKKARGYRNPTFAKKRGLTLNEEARAKQGENS
tara:strand:+ start:2760 stop:3065 length:306 start_codon:yes stop_codon:yes gene_type:complete